MNTKSYKISDNGIIRDMTADEKAELDSRQTPINLKFLKLADIRNIRNQKLSETDYLGVSDNTMSDEIKTWRTNLRNIPQDNTTEAKYDELLERKDDGSLKHSIWEKP